MPLARLCSRARDTDCCCCCRQDAGHGRVTTYILTCEAQSIMWNYNVDLAGNALWEDVYKADNLQGADYRTVVPRLDPSQHFSPHVSILRQSFRVGEVSPLSVLITHVDHPLTFMVRRTSPLYCSFLALLSDAEVDSPA